MEIRGLLAVATCEPCKGEGRVGLGENGGKAPCATCNGRGETVNPIALTALLGLLGQVQAAMEKERPRIILPERT